MKSILLSLPCDADADAINAEHDRAEAIRVGMMMFNDADVPRRHFPVPAILPGPWADKLVELKEHVGKGSLLALIGKRGTGKTQMGVELIRRACWKGLSAKYAKAMQFFTAIKDSYSKNAPESSVMDAYLKARVLVIDEAQERGETAWEDRLLTHLIDCRYGDMKDTVLISNLNRREFEASIGSSILSRMSETGGIIECNWPSFRDMAKPYQPYQPCEPCVVVEADAAGGQTQEGGG
jgi:hypothetical protein